MDITMDDFIMEELKIIRGFDIDYRHFHMDDPEKYPYEMTMEQWKEKLEKWKEENI